jgi:hypothetical protein
MRQATVRALGVRGLQGDTRALLAYARMVREAEVRTTADVREMLISLAQLRLEYAAAQARAPGKTPPPPHPDDLQFDWEALDIRINGPLDEAEVAEWADKQARRATLAAEIATARQSLTEAGISPEQRQTLEFAIALNEGAVRIIDACYPPEDVRRQPGFDLEAQRHRDQLGSPAGRAGAARWRWRGGGAKKTRS